MNERIKEAAFQAGFINKLVSDGSYFLNNPKLEAKLKKFSDLIRADEREACAKVCEGVAYVFAQPHHYATIIRERGNT